MSHPLVVSLFSGAGGLSRGFAEAGLRPIFGAEIDKDAVATYHANISDAVIQVDIAKEPDRIIQEIQSRTGNKSIFAVVGGPPCQGFSSAGNRNYSDERNRLIYSYFDIVERLQPSWFLFENVEGILTSGGGDAIVGLATKFAQLGYSFRIEKINFALWGIPQARKRVLIIGNRHGIQFTLPHAAFAFNGKKHRKSDGLKSSNLGDAIAGLPLLPAVSHEDSVSYVTKTPVTAYDALMRMQQHGPRAHACINFERDVERIRLLKPGQSLRELPEHLWPESFRSRAFRRVVDGMPTEKRGGAPAGLRRLECNHASLTITSFSVRELIHPTADRPLTLRECARLQSFPDNHDFYGNFQAIATQIGNAFPPIAAELLAIWMQATDGAIGGTIGPTSQSVPAGLLGYFLTGASGMSPALQITDKRLNDLALSNGRTTITRPPRRRKPEQEALFTEYDYATLGPEDRKIILENRGLGPITMSDREMARLVSVVLRDLGHDSLIPQWARDIPHGDYYAVSLEWFIRDQARPFDFGGFYLACSDAIENFRIIFRCITKLHRHRRKYEVILRSQPLPTMEQVARRGLLEYGTLPVGSLTSWLTWRKWIYDVDNRSAQETGYLFEPMLTESLGGRSVSAKASPVKRTDDKTKGRQVDCIVEIKGKKFAYEFKDRITIAASGQGRFAEELSFPRDCKASGYIPVLMVMDPTANPKLTAITKAFQKSGGKVFLGDEVWTHLSKLSGIEIANFVKRYIKDPIENIAVRERELLDMGLKYRSGAEGDSVEVTIGSHTWTIPRPRRDDAVAVDDSEGIE